MGGWIPLLILLATICVLTGPVALIVALVALAKTRKLQRRQSVSRDLGRFKPSRDAGTTMEELLAARRSERETLGSEPTSAGDKPTPVERVSIEVVTPPVREGVSLEQRIGTRWVLVAGVITVIFAVAFFLKYAYDQQWIGPLGRVIIAGVGGLVALGVGEVTRRLGYGVVAKGVTALGFAILYATVFAAHRWYALIDATPAYALAIGVTVAAMVYAVTLDEMIAAMLALTGGYLTPVLLSTGQNLPTPLFSYVLILSAGAMLCAFRRNWTAVDLVAFIGTFALYTGWFERFYRPQMIGDSLPEQLAVALFWLTVFFLVYLVLPLLPTFVQRIRSQRRDVVVILANVMILANAAVVFYYLWTILFHHHRESLAGCSLGMGAVHLVLTGFVLIRSGEDSDLWHALLATGLAFVTLAVPLYFRLYAVAVIWAVEGLVLAVIGLRCRNALIQIAAACVGVLTVGKLVLDLPMHDEPFDVILNVPFGTWCLVAAVVLACHVAYRCNPRLEPNLRQTATEWLYTVGLFLLMAAVMMELWHHGDLNIAKGRGMTFFREQMPLVMAAAVLLFVAQPLVPRGSLCRAVATLLAASGSVYLVSIYTEFHDRAFTLFANRDFGRAGVFVVILFAGGCWLRRDERRDEAPPVLSAGFALAGVGVLWALLTEEIWYYFRLSRPEGNWAVLAHTAISVMWALYATALMVIGFWRRIRNLRYLALGLFLLLLAKIFLVDTRTAETVYRIGGFLATGLALVGVSYLYQHLKKSGFFSRMLADDSGDVSEGEDAGDA